ncbi:MAG: hypothetical protein NC832_01815, partial [Candidatus Omnitrophica bacterium]|nr:hypothetical protein [Candidatus Omnitrophota bacterium]
SEYTPTNVESVDVNEALLADAETYASMIGVGSDEAIKRLKLQDIVERLNWNFVFERCMTACPVKGNKKRV